MTTTKEQLTDKYSMMTALGDDLEAAIRRRIDTLENEVDKFNRLAKDASDQDNGDEAQQFEKWAEDAESDLKEAQKDLDVLSA